MISFGLFQLELASYTLHVSKGVVIIYGKGGQWNRGDREFECKKLEGAGQNFNAQLHGGGV